MRSWNMCVYCAKTLPCLMSRIHLHRALFAGATTFLSLGLFAQCGTQVYDSGGIGSPYANNENFTWTYCAPAGQVITLNFAAFSLEAGYDLLSIHDGPTNASPTLGTFSGTATPSPISGTVPGGCVTLWFTSDGSVAYQGWAINISCAPPVPPPPVCGTTVYDPGGPSSNYANNTNLVTTYCPSTPGDVVTLTFSQFSTEANYDVFTVYNGPNAGSPSLGSFSGTGIPGPFTSTAPSGCLTIGFISDGSIPYPGWTAVVSCATPPPPPSGDCIYSLNLQDSWGDGWGSSRVGVRINGGAWTYYTVTGSMNNVLFGMNIGDFIELTYDASGPYQYENSYTLGLSGGGSYFNSGSPPTAGPVFGQLVDCSTPPTVPQDCNGGFTICNGQTFNNNSQNTGNVVDLNGTNQGCLSSGERQGTWYYFSPSSSGTIGFTISPTVVTDYDFAVWGPMSSVSCPPATTPYRCSYAAPTGDTGAGNGASDLTETASGDRWVAPMNVIAGQVYIMYVDNFSSNGQSFNLSWQLSNGASLDCTLLPVELVNLKATPEVDRIGLDWTTLSESNSAHFIVERSSDGQHFSRIGSLFAAGNSQIALDYQFIDQAPNSGLNYYRVTLVDQDGSELHSPVVSASIGHRPGQPLLSPNPVSELVQITLAPGTADVTSIDLIDAAGRVVKTFTLPQESGRTSITLPMSGLEQGSYILRTHTVTGPLTPVPFIKE